MQVELKFSKEIKTVNVADKNWLGALLPNAYTASESEETLVQLSLESPIDSKRLKEIVKAGESVVIVTSDITRPMPSYKVLPSVVHELESAGVQIKDITIVLALGSHRSHTDTEREALVGKQLIERGLRVIDSDMESCVNLGMCVHGTPVDVFTEVAQADRVICLGNIEYHYFAGYSGGAKAIMPGVSSHAAIQANHKNMVHPLACAGNLDTNPLRQDIDEVATKFKIDFIVNVVLDPKKNIIGAFAGHWKSAHRKGCQFLDEIYGVKFKEKADIVMVSPGGYPKDINLYQSQKGLDNSKHAVKDGGASILCASAKEGFGEKTFEEWMLNMTAEERVSEIQKNFKLGGHKAAAIGLVQNKATVYMVTDLPQEIVEKIGFVYCESLENAVNQAILEQGENAKILAMPSAGSTLPLLENS